MSLPLVSIIITSYNRANWVGTAIESALAQNYPNFEVVISDNCSTDNSDEIIKSYCHDPRVRYSRNESNIGMLANFEKAFFTLAKGEYITNVSSDDYLNSTTFITKAVEIFKKYEDVSVVFGLANSYYEKTKTMVPSPLTGKFDVEYRKGKDVFLGYCNNPYYSAGGALYSMSELRKHNIRFLGRVTSDVEFNLQMMLYGNVGFINEVVYVIRYHGENVSGTFKVASEVENMYLDVYKFIYERAEKVIEDKEALNTWYRKLQLKYIRLSFDMVIPKRDRRQTNLLIGIIYRKYRKVFLWFLFSQPKYIAKIILNR